MSHWKIKAFQRDSYIAICRGMARNSLVDLPEVRVIKAFVSEKVKNFTDCSQTIKL